VEYVLFSIFKCLLALLPKPLPTYAPVEPLPFNPTAGRDALIVVAMLLQLLLLLLLLLLLEARNNNYCYRKDKV